MFLFVVTSVVSCNDLKIVHSAIYIYPFGSVKSADKFKNYQKMLFV